MQERDRLGAAPLDGVDVFVFSEACAEVLEVIARVVARRVKIDVALGPASPRMAIRVGTRTRLVEWTDDSRAGPLRIEVAADHERQEMVAAALRLKNGL